MSDRKLAVRKPNVFRRWIVLDSFTDLRSTESQQLQRWENHMAEQMGVDAEFARMKGNMERLKELWKKWDDCGPAKVFVQQLDDLIHGKPLSYPNCQMCEERGKVIVWDEYAVNFGSCDDCLNRHLKKDGLS